MRGPKLINLELAIQAMAMQCDICRRNGFEEFADRVMQMTEWLRFLPFTRTPDPAQIRADAIRELAEIIRDWRNSIPMTGEECANAILALLATPLSPTAVDGSQAPDAGGKGEAK